MAGAPTRTDFIRCSPLEIAAGWMHGLLPARLLPDTTQHPREALDNAIRPSLINAPCYITFSGGRDSSAVLAAAASLARREGHALPIPVTRVYPGIPDADEDRWQHLVIEHLHLREWIRIPLQGAAADLLSATARRELLHHGLVWPVSMHSFATLYERLSAGSLVSGEGGDASLGLRRGTGLTVLRNGRRPTAALLGTVASELLPDRVRRSRARRAALMTRHAEWLSPEALHQHAALSAEPVAAEPLRYDKATWFLTRIRAFGVLRHNQAVHARHHGLIASEPLLHEGFLAALARHGGRWGFNGRTATMRALFADVLPEPVLSRSTKASFNRAYGNEETRAFARNWDGSGVDATLVKADKLRAIWLSDQPTMGTALLLHSAWLASQRGQ